MKNKKICICLSGIDGAGKTLIANQLIENLGKSPKVKYIWSRYKNYFSKPFLLLMRVTGHNYKVKINEIKIGYHDFYKNRYISIIFLILQWIDIFIEILFRFKMSRKSIVSDRSLIDTLVDLIIDTNFEKFISGSYAKSLFYFMPKNATYFIIERDIELIKKNRPDVFYDKNALKRIELYKKIANLFAIKIIKNESNLNLTSDKILSNIDPK